MRATPDPGRARPLDRPASPGGGSAGTLLGVGVAVLDLINEVEVYPAVGPVPLHRVADAGSASR